MACFPGVVKQGDIAAVVQDKKDWKEFIATLIANAASFFISKFMKKGGKLDSIHNATVTRDGGT